ncbi:MAG: hydroxyectoine utilization dehydratase EutB [Anaerolineae bacterium]
MAAFDVTLADIFQARRRIAPLMVRTPLIPAASLGERAGGPVYLKLENVQPTGAFKLRGAANKVLSLSEAERARGVLAVSSGNHGQAVAYVAARLGVRSVICLSEAVPPHKVAGIRRWGAEVIIAGRSYDEAADEAAHLCEVNGMTFIHPFDDPAVIAGQGTIGLEVLEDLPDVRTLVVPLSGGGLIAGIALAAKAAAPLIRVIGVSMERGPVMARSLQAGQVLTLPEEPTLADALMGGIGPDNRHTFRMCQQLVDEVVLVSEEEIAAAMAFMLHEHHLVVEGGGAVGIAALLHRRAAVRGPAVVVISGGSVSIPLLMDIAARHRA